MNGAATVLLVGALLTGSDAKRPRADAETEAELSRLRSAVETNKGDAATRWNLGYALYRVGRFDAAMAEFERAESMGDHAYPVMMQGVVAEHQLRWQTALAAYERSLERDPAFQPAIENLARLRGYLVQIDRFRDARDLVTRDLLVVLTAAGVLVAASLVWARRPRVDVRSA